MKEVVEFPVEKEKISVRDFIESYWGEIIYLFDKIMDYKFFEPDIVWLVWDMVHEVKDEIERKGDAFWAFKNKEAYAIGYMRKGQMSAKVIVNTEYKRLLVAVKIDWFEFKCSVEVEVNNNKPKFTFWVIEKN
jgi:hypothetical protein